MNDTVIMNSTSSNTIAIELPQWVADLHEFRLRLFLKIVEPLIVFILGEANIEDDHQISSSDLTSSNYGNVTTHDFDWNFSDARQEHRRLNFMPDYVKDLNSFRETSMSFATLTVLFLIMSCVALVFLSCFYHNQKTSPLFISPRRHRLPKLVPPPLPVKGIFTWIRVCFYMSDEEIVNRVGYDSLIFLRFHRLALRCIVKMSAFSFFVILPINFTGGGHLNADNLKNIFFTDFLRFTMANVNGGSPRLWVHCIAAYLLSAIVMRELVAEYNAFHSIRHRYLLSKEPHLRTILVTNIPRHLRSPSKLHNYFKHVYPNAIQSVTACQNLINLETLVSQRTAILLKIERELLLLCKREKRKFVGKSRFEKYGCMPFACCENFDLFDGAQERLAKLYCKLEELNDLVEKEQDRRKRIMAKMDTMEAGKGRKDIDYILATSFDHKVLGDTYRRSLAEKRVKHDSAQNPTHDRKIHDTDTSLSTLPEESFVEGEHNIFDDPNKKAKRKMFLRAKHAIKRYSKSVRNVNLLGVPRKTLIENITEMDGDLHRLENHTNEVTDKVFVRMKTFTASTIAIQSMHSSKPGAMEVTTAPEPRDVLWENIYVSKGARRTRGIIADVIVIILITFYIVPIALVSLLVSETALISSSPRLAQLDQASALFSSIIAMVQPVCLVTIQQILPPLFMQISKAEGLVAFSEAQMKAFSRYFMFQVLNIFLVTSIAGSIFDTIAIIVDNPEKSFEMLGNSLPRMSSFFVTFIILKTFLGLGVELARCMSIVQSSLRYLLFPNSTLRQKRRVRIGMRAIDDPGWFPFHKVLAQDMLVVVIGVVFAVVAPIVLFPCALFCLFARIMWTHHHLYVYESVFESGGQFWPKIFRRFIFGLIIAQMTITGQFILKEARHEAYATIALMFLTYFFLRSTRARYDGPSSTLPLEVAAVMDIAVQQEEDEASQSYSREALDRAEMLSQAASIDQLSVAPDAEALGTDKTESQLGRIFGHVDPFELAYIQPALRATPRARPEQPFPPAQLGREEILMQSKPMTSGMKKSIENDDKASVRLKSLNQNDRKLVDQWWEDQFDVAGKQNFFSVLAGTESGTLRLGRSTRKSIKSSDII